MENVVFKKNVTFVISAKLELWNCPPIGRLICSEHCSYYNDWKNVKSIDLKLSSVTLVSAGKKFLVKVRHKGVNVRTRKGYRKS